MHLYQRMLNLGHNLSEVPRMKAQFKIFENYYGFPVEIYYDPHIKVVINGIDNWQEIKSLSGKFKTEQSAINAAKEWYGLETN